MATATLALPSAPATSLFQVAASRFAKVLTDGDDHAGATDPAAQPRREG